MGTNLLISVYLNHKTEARIRLIKDSESIIHEE